MRGTVTIGNKDVEFVSNALTPVLFKRVFHKDFLMETQKKDTDLTVFQELAYIMASQAKDLTSKELMNSVSEEGYYDWLTEFGAMDLMEKVNDIFVIYNSQTQTTSKSKKNR